MNKPMGFGKYKELTPEKIMVLNPSYLIWAHSNTSFFRLNPEDYKNCKQRYETRLYEKRRIYRPRRYVYADNEDTDYSDRTQSY